MAVYEVDSELAGSVPVTRLARRRVAVLAILPNLVAIVRTSDDLECAPDSAVFLKLMGIIGA